MKLVIKYISILIAVTLLPGSLWAQKTNIVTLQLKWEHQFQFAGYYAAIEKGYYQQAGIKVNLVEAVDSLNPSDAVFSGKADFGICGSEILLMRANHQKAVILATFFQHSPQILLASKQSGIKHLQDLAGKRLALEANSDEIIASMDNEGVSLNECSMVTYSYNPAEMLIQGQVDAISAYSTDEPYRLKQANFEYTVITPSVSSIDFYGDLLFTSAQFIKNNPELTENFRNASIKGWHYAMEHPGEIIDLIYNKYSKRHSIDYLKFEADQMKSLVMADVVEPGYSNPIRWQAITDTYKKLKMLDASFTTQGLLYSDYIRSAPFIPLKMIFMMIIIIFIVCSLAYFFYYTSQKLRTEIKNRSRVEEDLKQSEEHYRDLFNANSAAMAVIEADTTVSMVNDAYCQLTGFTREESLGTSWVQHIPAGDRERMMEYNRNRLLDPAKAPSRYEFTFIHKNGEIIHSIMSVTVNEKTRKTVASFIDISERIKLENSLRESEEKFREMANLLPQIVFETDMQGKLTYANKQAFSILRYPENFDINGLNTIELYIPEDKPRAIENIRRRMTGEKEESNEYTMRRFDGSLINVLVYSNPIVKGNKRVGLRGIIVDITEIKSAVEELRQSEFKYRILTESMNDVVWTLDPKTMRFLYVSPSVEKLRGYTPEEVMSVPFDAALTPEGAAYVRNELHGEINKFLVSSVSQPYFSAKELEQPCKDGSSVWTEVVTNFYRNNNNQIEVLGVTRDITERKRAEDELRENELQYRILANSGRALIWRAGTDKLCNYFNKIWLEFTGRTLEQEMGNGWAEGVHPDDLDKCIKIYTTSFDKREPFEMEYRLRHSSGEYRWLIDIGTPNFDSTGKFIGYIGHCFDISDRKQAEEILRETNSYLENLINYANSPIIVWDPNFCITRFNHAFESLTGRLEEDVKGKSLEILFPPELAGNSMELIRKTLSGERWETVEIEILNIDNSKHTVLWNSATLFAADGITPVATIAQGQEITRRIAAEKELKFINDELITLNTEKDKFFSIIAHDLRGPIGGFMGLTQIMAERLPELTMEEVREIAVSMRNSSTNLFRLLENLLHWARIEQGLIPFEPKIFHLRPVINESIVMSLQPASIKGVELVCSVADDLEAVADINMLQTIIRNLVSNAVKFTPGGGKVTISAKMAEDRSVEISVQDSGIGMSSSMIADLFRLDIQTSRRGTASEPSTGLGLIICKEFIEKHRSKLRIESQVKAGSTFSFILPARVQEEEIKTITEKIQVSGKTKQTKTLKILIAEDDDTSGMLLSLALKPLSNEIIVVKSGGDAVDVCKASPNIDLIMMDIKMPDMDGYEATRQIRMFDQRVVIIAQTAFGLPGDRSRAMNAGCNDFMAKPISIAVLKELIQMHFNL